MEAPVTPSSPGVDSAARNVYSGLQKLDAFQVPIGTRTVQAEAIMEDSPYHSEDSPSTPPTVLVVDDEPTIREVVACMLEDEGYAVRQATDGLEALQEIEAEEIDLVLSDVMMPGLDGPALVRGLRRRRLAVRVVLMSAVSTAVDLPGVPFLPKPFESERLLNTVAAAIAASGRSARPGSGAWSTPR